MFFLCCLRFGFFSSDLLEEEYKRYKCNACKVGYNAGYNHAKSACKGNDTLVPGHMLIHIAFHTSGNNINTAKCRYNKKNYLIPGLV